MEKKSYIFNEVMIETKNGKEVPKIDSKFTNGIPTNNLNIFKDICLRNKENLNSIALEINGNQMTYLEFFMEVEKYMESFDAIGVKEGTVVSLCLPVSVEFICSYFALSTMGAICNSSNIGFLLADGINAYTKERCSDILICYDKFYELLEKNNAFKDTHIKNIIISSDSTYAHYHSDTNKIIIPGIEKTNQNRILTMDEFLKEKGKLKTVPLDINRPTIFAYTSGTTGKSKCMALSDLAPLLISASHEYIDRPNEKIGDRTLVTIPLQHPTGLFYSMVLQLAEGKTLVLEPRYKKELFGEDIKNLKINHAVQAKPFYAQLIADYQNDKLKDNDFIYDDGTKFTSPYSGGEGIPLPDCQAINKVLSKLGCENELTIGYGRSEEGSICMAAYGILNRNNTDGLPIPGIDARIVDENGKVIATIDKSGHLISKGGNRKGEIQLSSPIGPLGHCYLNKFNEPGKHDGSFIENGKRWSTPGDIATIVKCGNGKYSYYVLGRKSDYIIKNNEKIYLFDLKEEISKLKEIKECEIINLIDEDNSITCHIVLNNDFKDKYQEITKKISLMPNIGKYISGIKFYNVFGINTTSGKCDREAMKKDKKGYYTIDINGEVKQYDFDEHSKVLIKGLLRN